jgi:hypothetical protein
MGWQGASRRLLPQVGRHDCAGFSSGSFGYRCVFGGSLFELGQLQLELVDEPLAPLAGLAELLASAFGEEQTQAFDLEAGSRDRSLGLLPSTALGQDHRVRRGEIGWRDCRLVAHELDASTFNSVL